MSLRSELDFRFGTSTDGGFGENGIAGGGAGVEADFDLLRITGDEGEPGVGRGDRQFAPAAVHEDGEFDAARPAMVEKLVERGLHRAAGVEDIVHKDDSRAIHVVRDDGRRKFLGDGVAADVVAVKRDVDRAGARSKARFFQLRGEALGEDDAAVGYPQEQQAGGFPVALGDGGSDPGDRLVDRFGVVLRRWGHEPKVLRAGMGAVQRKGANGVIKRSETGKTDQDFQPRRPRRPRRDAKSDQGIYSHGFHGLTRIIPKAGLTTNGH